MHDGVPEGIAGDVSRLRQVLLNLLSNAIKFTPSGGLVAVEVRAAFVGADRELLFTVRDSGIGMTPEQLGRLFQPFMQADSSTTRLHGGTGLGLSISKRLAELMNGRIWAESQPGQGSAFSFTIRAEVATLPPAQREPLPPATLRGRRLLIVDDIEINRRILLHYAGVWGMDARATELPREALAWVRAGESFDLALLDFHMPEMDGLRLAKELRQLRSEAQLPIVMLTSVQLDGHYAGVVSASVVKPIRPARLLDAILGWYSKAAAPQPGGKSRAELPADLAAHHPLRILVAEDNLVNQKVVQLLLRRMGYAADFAANGAEALQAVARQAYDVVFMDVQMPVMDGLEASRQLVAQQPLGQRPRIVGMTANAMAEDRQAALESGMDDYVTKPISVDALVAALSRCVRIEYAAA